MSHKPPRILVTAATDRLNREVFLQSDPDTDPVWKDDQTGAIKVETVPDMEEQIRRLKDERRHANLAGIEESDAKWSQKVTDEADFHTKEGVFKQSAEKIATYLLSKGKAKAASRLAFYMNRAGKNLSSEDRARLNKAKTLIQEKANLYAETATAFDPAFIDQDWVRRKAVLDKHHHAREAVGHGQDLAEAQLDAINQENLAQATSCPVEREYRMELARRYWQAAKEQAIKVEFHKSQSL